MTNSVISNGKCRLRRNNRFPKGINCDILTEQVNIDGKEYSAQGTSFADGDERFILWRVNTLTDVLMQLGSTNTYADICYLLSQARSDVAKATQNCNEDNALNSIQRNIEVLSELATVIYRKTPPAPAIYFFEKLNKIIERANKEMSSIPIVSGSAPTSLYMRIYLST